MYPDVQMKKQGLLTALLAECTGVRVQQDWRPLNPTLLFILYCTVHCAKKKCALVNIFGSVAGITGYDGKGSPIIFTEYSRFAKQ